MAMTRSRPKAQALLALVLVAGLLPLAVHPAAADAAQLHEATVPSQRIEGAAAWAGGKAWHFGGRSTADWTTLHADILRFDPATGSLAVVGALPGPRAFFAAAEALGKVYLLGGGHCAGEHPACDEVWEFDPADGAVRLLGARLPQRASLLAAVGDGEVVWAFGGTGMASGTQVWRLDPAADRVDAMAATLPGARWHAAAAWDGRYAYLLGGCCAAPGQPYDDILRYDPVADVVETLAVRLPYPVKEAAAFAHQGDLYLLGGACCGAAQAIVRVDLAAGTAQTLATELPRPLYAAPLAWSGEVAHVLGGYGASAEHVMSYRPGLAGPSAAIARVPPAECVAGRAEVALDGSRSHHHAGLPLAFAWSAPGIAFDDPGAVRPRASFPLGATMVTLTVHDGAASDVVTALVRVADTQAPLVDLERPRPGAAYVLDQELALPAQAAAVVGGVTVRAAASDACGVAQVVFRGSDGSSASDPQAPYAWFLDPRLSVRTSFRVEAEALDLGGNRALDAVTFASVGTRL